MNINLNFSYKKIILISTSFIISTLLIKLLLSIKRKNREIKNLKYKYKKCINGSSSSSSS